MLILDFTLIYSEIICFVNLSGLVELRVRKDRVDRYLTNNDKMLQYLRRKIGDKLIYKITPYERIMGDEAYMIIRHPLQDIKEFIRVYNKLSNTISRNFVRKNIDLFNNLDFVIRFSKIAPIQYQYLPERFKHNRKVLEAVIFHDQFQYFPDKIKNNRNLVIYLIRLRGPSTCSFIKLINLHYRKINTLFRYLPYEFRKDLEIISLAMDDTLADAACYSVMSHIPDNLINDRNFILSFNDCNINILSNIYYSLSMELARDYEILVKLGYRIMGYKSDYSRIMTPEMKSNIELHRKLVKLNPSIYNLMSEELQNIIPKY
jgi:hypothetical protein